MKTIDYKALRCSCSTKNTRIHRIMQKRHMIMAHLVNDNTRMYIYIHTSIKKTHRVVCVCVHTYIHQIEYAVYISQPYNNFL